MAHTRTETNGRHVWPAMKTRAGRKPKAKTKVMTKRRKAAPKPTPLYREDLLALLVNKLQGCICPAELVGGCHGDGCPRRPAQAASFLVSVPDGWEAWGSSVPEEPAQSQEPETTPTGRTRNPDLTARNTRIASAALNGDSDDAIAAREGISRLTVAAIRRAAGINRPRGAASHAARQVEPAT